MLYDLYDYHTKSCMICMIHVYRCTPALGSGVTAAQIFFGCESLVANVCGLKTDKEFVTTLEDNIQEWGGMDKLISDCAKAEMSECVKQIL
jgi:hypothetical protein